MITFQASDEIIYQDINAVFFDKDGTLIDSHFYWGSIIKARSALIVDKLRLDPSKYSDICYSMGFCVQREKLIEEGPVALESRSVVIDKVNRFLNNMGFSVVDTEIEQIFDLVSTEMQDNYEIVKPIEDAVSVLKILKSMDVNVAIITSDSELNTCKFIDKIGLSSSDIMLICRDNYEHSKKSGLPAIYAAEKMSINIDSCLVIGDAPMDYHMAVNSGAMHLLVSTGQLSYDTLRQNTNNVVASLSNVRVY